MPSLAQTHNGGKAISLLFDKEPLRIVLDEVRDQSGYNIIYNDKLIDNITISCNIKNLGVEEALNKILSDHNISFKLFKNNSIVLFKGKQPEPKEPKPVVIKENKPDTLNIPAFVKPKLLTKTNPVYPPHAVRANIKGDVVVRLFVNQSGDVTETQVTKSSTHTILDSATIDYAKNLKFNPALENGKPVGVWTEMTFHYYFIVNSDSLD